MERKAELLERLAQEVYTYNGCFEDISEVFTSLEDLIEVSGKSGEEIARATFFGDIKNWCDSYFYINAYGNFESCSEREHEISILAQEKDIINEFLDIYYYNNTECLEPEHLEILTELKALGVEVPEDIKND